MGRPRSDIAPRILRAARARFLAEGVDGAALRAVANDAGTSIGMVYYYFSTKEALFLAVVEETYVGLLASLEQELSPEIPAAERLRRFYARVGRLSGDEATMLRLVIREALSSPARLERLIARFRRGHIPLLLQLVADGRREGLFDPELPPAMVLAALVAIGGPAQLILQQAAARLPLGPIPGRSGLPDALAGILLDGVRGRGAPTRIRAGRRRPARKADS